MLTRDAPAKVNLYLHVTGRRPDGYHLLDSLVVFAGVADEVRAEPGGRLSLTLYGPFAAGLDAGGDNLVLRAARALAAAAGVTAGARLTLDKRLPVASGIGGGSADAAATLIVLSEMWGVRLANGALAMLAQRLGADVPVCLAGRPARMGGTGEALGPAPELPECGLLLVNPGIAVSTAEVFAARAGGWSEAANLPERWTDAVAMASDLRALDNDLERPARALCPAIGVTLAAIGSRRGCLLARMSGSGATCYGLFGTAWAAAEAATSLARAGWWCWGGALRGT